MLYLSYFICPKIKLITVWICIIPKLDLMDGLAGPDLLCGAPGSVHHWYEPHRGDCAMQT